jgi:hypothetical protein
MDFNNLVFPAPSNQISIMDYKNEIIYIPRNKKDKYKENLGFKNDTYSTKDYVPALLLLTSQECISKNFCIYFHGNAEDIFIARDLADKLRFCFDLNLLIVEYPGYSLYFDEKNCETVLENSVIAFDFLVEELNISPENILVIGRSIGTGPACYLGSKRNPEGIILISPFTSIRSVAEKIVGGFFKYLISEKFENIKFIKDIVSPVLFIHGQLDELIPFDHTLKLKDECKCPHEVILPENMNHNDFNLDEDFLVPIRNFMKRFTRLKNHNFFALNYKLIPEVFKIMPMCIEEMIKKSDIVSKDGIMSCCQ